MIIRLCEISQSLFICAPSGAHFTRAHREIAASLARKRNYTALNAEEIGVVRKMNKRNKYFEFYKRVITVALPIMLQNGISNFVSLLDNIMIGRVGTDQMSGVAIVNQLVFVFYLCIFGAISGAGIFTAQYYGQKNMEGVRDTFRFKLVMAIVIYIAALFIFITFGDQLISLYLHDGGETGNIELTLKYAKEYLYIMLIGLLPNAIENCYSSTLRETGTTVVSMCASVVAVVVNLVLDYVLIYGKFGMPVLGVRGAAIATVISRFIQLAIVVGWTHMHKNIKPFVSGLYKKLIIDGRLAKKIIIMGTPLLFNETLWAAGIAAQISEYSVRGLAVVAGLNINSTINNVFNVAFVALGDAVAIMVGQLLGAGKLKEAKQTAYRIIKFSVFICIILGTLLYITAPLFPKIYNTTEEVRTLATRFLRVTAIVMPIQGFLHATYFTIRSGGKTLITFLFDSCFLWCIAVPLSLVLSKYTELGIITVFLLCNLVETIKLVIGLIILKSGIWANNIVEEKNVA